MVAYVVEGLADVTIASGKRYDGMDLMSPFVWREDRSYRMMVRCVPNPMTATSPSGIIACGTSTDGLAFRLDDKPAISPGPKPEDAGGCEDPTILTTDDGYKIFYTGVDAAHQQGSLLVADGPDIADLTERAVVLKAPPGEGNIKEATIVQAADGSWCLFYEYAAKDASRIGMASSRTADGPWTALADPFDIREDSWDNWHLSTGPICSIDGADPVMFYNGATNDARWRIGWISFDANYESVTGRCVEPVLVPPPPTERAMTDIAFAASAIVEDGMISLYYSLEDRMLRRACIRHYA